MKGSKLKNTSTVKSSAIKSTNVSQSMKYPPLKQQTPEDDYITSLQKQVYFLELEMKLMKDRELETKNKVGGYEVLFRDGVPLNEHFLALKTKYTNEKEHFEGIISNFNSTINRTEEENKYLQQQIEQTNKSYYELIENQSTANALYNARLFDLNAQLFNQMNTLTLFNENKEVNGKELYHFSSENVHHNRTIEKNNLFKETQEEKNEKRLNYNQEKFAEINKLTERSILELDSLEKKLMGNSRLKEIEKENEDFISALNRLERESHMAQAKISELENTQTLNKKYLLEEEMLRDIHLKENTKLNLDLDNLSKLNEDKLKEKVKESEERQILMIKNQISNSELRMGMLLENYKDIENIAKDYLEEKNTLAQKISMLHEDNMRQLDTEINAKQEIVDVKNTINQLEVVIEENNNQLDALINENEQLRGINDRYEKDIKELRIKIEEIQQKIELNSMLKDIDVGELKMLTQNNAMVNNSINSLMTKWDKVHAKLTEIESKEKK